MTSVVACSPGLSAPRARASLSLEVCQKTRVPTGNPTNNESRNHEPLYPPKRKVAVNQGELSLHVRCPPSRKRSIFALARRLGPARELLAHEKPARPLHRSRRQTVLHRARPALAEANHDQHSVRCNQRPPECVLRDLQLCDPRHRQVNKAVQTIL